mmetsp:Transcript_40532/g.74966  ORF Transcript_40532/g.74966 Transcript_40532/m.74966 type:complete len:397 (-) Transcript_40532:611-1801(-)
MAQFDTTLYPSGTSIQYNETSAAQAAEGAIASWVRATVLHTNVEDPEQPFYTIKLGDGREKQTLGNRIRAIAVAAGSRIPLNVGGNVTAANKFMIYTTPTTGNREEVEVVKDYNDGEASVFIPSLGRERNVLFENLTPCPEPAFAAGLYVKVCGLSSRPEMNGSAGFVTGFNAAKGRHTVRFAKAKKDSLLRAENLEAALPPPAAVAAESSRLTAEADAKQEAEARVEAAARAEAAKQQAEKKARGVAEKKAAAAAAAAFSASAAIDLSASTFSLFSANALDLAAAAAASVVVSAVKPALRKHGSSFSSNTQRSKLFFFSPPSSSTSSSSPRGPRDSASNSADLSSAPKRQNPLRRASKVSSGISLRKDPEKMPPLTGSKRSVDMPHPTNSVSTFL